MCRKCMHPSLTSAVEKEGRKRVYCMPFWWKVNLVLSKGEYTRHKSCSGHVFVDLFFKLLYVFRCLRIVQEPGLFVVKQCLNNALQHSIHVNSFFPIVNDSKCYANSPIWTSLEVPSWWTRCKEVTSLYAVCTSCSHMDPGPSGSWMATVWSSIWQHLCMKYTAFFVLDFWTRVPRKHNFDMRSTCFLSSHSSQAVCFFITPSEIVRD